MKDKPETLIQPTMGIKWNSGSLLDMEAHMVSATQNNSKRTKETICRILRLTTFNSFSSMCQ